MSGRIVYAYVGGNPLSRIDPLGLCPNPDYPDAISPTLGPLDLPLLAAALEGAAESVVNYIADALGVGAGDTPASVPTGQSGSPMDVAPGTNSPATINGIDYSGHALDQMQGRGFVPSVVENTIETGTALPGNLPGTTVMYDPVNNVRVVMNSSTGKVITVIPGAP